MVGMDKTVIELAKEKAAADQAYESAICAHLRTFKPMDTGQFWKVIDQLQANIVKRLSHGGVKAAAHNLLCDQVYRHPEEEQMGAWEDMARFLACYEVVKNNLSIKMDDMPGLDRGNDSYSDLIDSLPLAGQKIMMAIIVDDIANGKQLEAALADHPLATFILHGENYVTMTFKQGLLKAFVSVSREYEEERKLPVELHVVMIMEPLTVEYSRRESGLAVKVRGPFNSEREAMEFSRQQGNGVVALLLEGIIKR